MKNKILEVVKNALEIDVIDETCSQKTCVEWDSLHHLTVVIDLESEFDVEFDPEEIAQMKSIIDIENILNDKI